MACGQKGALYLPEEKKPAVNQNNSNPNTAFAGQRGQEK